MALQAAPDLSQFKDWLGLDEPELDTTDDVVLQQSLDAAIAAQAAVCSLPTDDFGDSGYTPDLVEAIYIRTLRLASRRNSPEGVVGLSGAGGDFVAARIPSFDNDVLHLEGPWRKIVVA